MTQWVVVDRQTYQDEKDEQQYVRADDVIPVLAGDESADEPD